MAITAEWIKNKDKKRIYAISHSKAVVRGNSTVDADLSSIESSIEELDQKIEDKKAGLVEVEYSVWKNYTAAQKQALGDVLVMNYPMEFTMGDLNEVAEDLRDTSTRNLNNITKIQNIIGNNNSAGSHNCIYRGKYLGDALSSEQAASIAAGTFEDMYIGDYWLIDGITYRIAAFDYWYNKGDTACNKHHVVVVPDTNLYSTKMNDNPTTSGGYIGSDMYKTNLANAKTTFNNAFGSAHILNHREYFTNAITSGYPSGGIWTDSTVDLMNERMVYGASVYTPANSLGDTIPKLYTIDNEQLPLFALEPSRICNREPYWLRDVVSSAYFCNVSSYSSSNYVIASYSYGVRPAVGIC